VREFHRTHVKMCMHVHVRITPPRVFSPDRSFSENRYTGVRRGLLPRDTGYYISIISAPSLLPPRSLSASEYIAAAESEGRRGTERDGFGPVFGRRYLLSASRNFPAAARYAICSIRSHREIAAKDYSSTYSLLEEKSDLGQVPTIQSVCVQRLRLSRRIA